MNRIKIFGTFALLVAAGSCLVLASASQAATTGWDEIAPGAHDYNDTANWVDGNINGIWDASLDLPSSQTITFSANSVLSSGWSINYTGSANLTFTGAGGDRTVTLGGDILHNTGSSTRIITVGAGSGQSLHVDLGGATRTFTVGSGRTLGFVNNISNGGIYASGGTLNFSGTNTYSGSTTMDSGVFSLNGSTGSSANSDFFVNAGFGSTPQLRFNSSSGAGLVRAKSVTLNGAGDSTEVQFNVIGNSGANTIDSITGALSAAGGQSVITLSANAATNTRLSAGSFVRANGATVLFRGLSLGVNPFASPLAGSTNVQFGVAPSLVGGGGAAGTTTVSLLKGVLADSASGGTGFGSTGGLATYDAANGIRILGASEYKTSITDGQTALDNVRLTNGSEVASTVTLNSNTTINSLSLHVNATNSPITLNGTGILTLNSGTLYAFSESPAVAGAEMTIDSTLDFNGNEGVIFFRTNGSSNGTGGAKLNLTGVISNDGGNGLTFNGEGGVAEITGSTVNTYTGVTTINGGSVRLSKSVSNSAIVGDIVLNGGTLQISSNQISDTSNITVNGGTLFQKGGALNSGSGASETYQDLVMNGGGYSDGASGTSSGVTNLRHATMNGGNWSVTRGHKTNLSGNLTATGGTMDINRANDTSRTTVLTVNGNLAVGNTAADAYTPFSFFGGSGVDVDGGRMVLHGDLTFTGNSTNSNTVTFDASAPSSGGGNATIALEGTRTFNIGNGAASVDLAIEPELVNGSVAGGLTKTGAGTLLLGGMNSYSDGTVVSGGTLLVDGTLTGTSGVSVAAGAHLGGSGSVSATISGAGSIDPGNSPGIMTTTQVDPAGGLDFNFEFTLANSLPTWATTENDVLRITDATPFTQSLDSDNVITLYLDVNSLSYGDVFLGGFYTDEGDFLPQLTDSKVVAYMEALGGTTSYLGKNYNLIDVGSFSLSTLANSQFAPGGFVTQFTYNAPPIPEPSTSLLIMLGVGIFSQVRRQRRNRK